MKAVAPADTSWEFPWWFTVSPRRPLTSATGKDWNFSWTKEELGAQLLIRMRHSTLSPWYRQAIYPQLEEILIFLKVRKKERPTCWRQAASSGDYSRNCLQWGFPLPTQGLGWQWGAAADINWFLINIVPSLNDYIWLEVSLAFAWYESFIFHSF